MTDIERSIQLFWLTFVILQYWCKFCAKKLKQSDIMKNTVLLLQIQVLVFHAWEKWTWSMKMIRIWWFAFTNLLQSMLSLCLWYRFLIWVIFVKPLDSIWVFCIFLCELLLLLKRTQTYEIVQEPAINFLWSCTGTTLIFFLPVMYSIISPASTVKVIVILRFRPFTNFLKM